VSELGCVRYSRGPLSMQREREGCMQDKWGFYPLLPRCLCVFGGGFFDSTV